MGDLTGKTLGRYRIMERIGRGGMAEVYKGYQPSLDRYVAVKVLHSFLLEEEGSRDRFQREAKSVAVLRHPHIVQVFDFDNDGDEYYMVMEYVDGPNLKAVLGDQAREHKRLPLARVGEIITAIGGALGYAHKQGMIHRDVKPHNIMFTSEGTPMLTDFGIAKIVSGSNVSASGVLSGTPAYMSPEQGRAGTLDGRTDLYSLGVVLYEMLTGQVPFDADTPFAVVIKHINDPLPLPRTLNPDIPPALERVVFKAMAKDPAERFQTADEMVRAVQAAIHDYTTIDRIEQPANMARSTMDSQPAQGNQPANTLPQQTQPGQTPPYGNLPPGQTPPYGNLPPGQTPPYGNLPLGMMPPGQIPPYGTPTGYTPPQGNRFDFLPPGQTPPQGTPMSTQLAPPQQGNYPAPPPPYPPRPTAQVSTGMSAGRLGCTITVALLAVVVLMAGATGLFGLQKLGQQVASQMGPTVIAARPTIVAAIQAAMTEEAATQTATAGGVAVAAGGAAATPTAEVQGDEGAAATAPPNAAGAPNNTASQALAAQQYEAALAAYNTVLEKDPTNTDALLGKAQALLGLARYNEAADAAGAVINQPGDNMEAQMIRGHANMMMGNTDAAVKDYSDAIAAHPDDPEPLRDQGEVLLELGRVNDALEVLQKALDLDEDDPATLTALGRAYSTAAEGVTPQPDEALKALNTAISKDSNYAPAYAERARFYAYIKGDSVQAIVDITHALALGPPTAAWYKLRADIEAGQGYINPRIEDLKRAVAISPKDVELYLSLADAYLADGDLEKAVAAGDEAVGLQPDDPAVLAQRANLRLLRNNVDGAKADAQAAISKAKDDPTGYLALARVYMASSDYTNALAQAEEAVKRAPADGKAGSQLLRGRILVRLNQLDKADVDFQAVAAAFGEEHPDLLLGQAELAIARKDADTALSALRKWESTDPHYGWGYVLRATIEQEANQPVKAAASLEQARKRALYPEERKQAEALAAKLR